jgi:hypothetical protein
METIAHIDLSVDEVKRVVARARAAALPGTGGSIIPDWMT